MRVVATEATRGAVNSEDYRRQIESKTGWKVEMLAKEDEGRIGAMGIASSFSSVKGLALDLGGGSVQLTWLTAKNGNIETSSKGSVSFPYGAAALMRLLESTAGASEQDELQKELAGDFETALDDLDMPSSLIGDAEEEGGFTLYLSGGGFRGWGYLLMSIHAAQPYPIPIINGFRVPQSSFLPKLSQSPTEGSTFRISSRRATQVPAVKFLITALIKSLPSISNIYFAQGGLREGLLFSRLPAAIRSQDPLVTATVQYAPVSTPILAALLLSALPPSLVEHDVNPTPPLPSPDFLTATIHLLMAHANLPKDIRAAAALRTTTTGLLANAHGISHDERALLALVLCERWGGELSPSDTDFHANLQELIGQKASWWAKYLGRVARGIGDVFPAGLVREAEKDSTVKLKVEWSTSSSTKKMKTSSATEKVISMEILQLRQGIDGVLDDWRDGLEKVGKRKHWVGGERGFGCRVEVRVERRVGS